MVWSHLQLDPSGVDIVVPLSPAGVQVHTMNDRSAAERCQALRMTKPLKRTHSADDEVARSSGNRIQKAKTLVLKTPGQMTGGV